MISLGGLLFEGGGGLLDDDVERRFVLHGEIGEDLAVETDVRGLQPFDETAVGETLRADSGAERLIQSARKLRLRVLRSR